MGVKRKHEDEAEVAEPELTGFMQDDTLYLRDGGGCVYSSERNWRGELVAVGRWDGASVQLDKQDPTPSGWGPLSTLRDPVEDKRRTEELTREIGGYAQRKQLQKATETYEQLQREGLKPTTYTFSNLLNAHINSGDVAGGHRVFNNMVAAGHRPNVIVYTTMLKGLCSVGELGEAMLLLQRMAHASPPVPADIRTLNTFLRGCVRAGRLAPARWAFDHLAQWRVTADHVAFSAFARLLAQALRLDETRELVRSRREARLAQLELRAAARRGEGPPPPPRSVPCSFWLEGRCERGLNCRFYHDPAVPQQNESNQVADERDAEATQEVHMAHAAALLGRRKTSLSALSRAEALLAEAEGSGGGSGGGDGWWGGEANDDEGLSSAFRRGELVREIARIKAFLEGATGAAGAAGAAASSVVTRRSSRRALLRCLCRCFLFGTASSPACAAPAPQRRPFLPRESLSVCPFSVHEDGGAPPPPPPPPPKLGLKRDLAERLLSSLCDTLGLEAAAGSGEAGAERGAEGGGSLTRCRRRLRRALSRKGRLRWESIFASEPELPVKLEIASGTGDWVVAQALADQGKAHWAALEIKHDRVAAILSRMVMRGARNLAVVGGDGGQVLREHVKPRSVAHVFVNFPEPPHRSGDEDAVQVSELHLLTADFFKAVHRVLKPGGRFTLFSDNHRYCQSLARTVGALRSPEGNPLLLSEVLAKGPSFESIEGVRIYHGAPGPAAGHLVEGGEASSYFDRFWQHGQHVDRFFILLSRG